MDQIVYPIADILTVIVIIALAGMGVAGLRNGGDYNGTGRGAAIVCLIIAIVLLVIWANSLFGR